MKYSLAIFIFYLFANYTHAQETDSSAQPDIEYSTQFMPIECLDSILYLEKMEEITNHKFSLLIAEKERDYDKDLVIEGIDFYNKVAVTKFNQQFEEISANEKKLEIATVYLSDCEKLPRYSIRTEYNYGYYDAHSHIATYAIFDNEKNIRYKSFFTLELLIEALRKGKIYTDAGATRDQEDLDNYFKRKGWRLYRETNPIAGSGPDVALIFAGVLSLALLIAIFATM